MKRIAVVMVVFLLFAEFVFMYIQPHEFGFDFRMRYNEVKCILEGTDPLFIWNGTVSSSVYTPFAWKYVFRDEGLNLVHSYPPWSYTFLMPFALFPRGTAMVMFIAFEMICMFVLFAAAFQWGFERRKSFGEGCLCLCIVAVTCVMEPVMNCLRVLNYGILVSVALLGLIVCLNRRYDILAGICWAFMMLKPQIALLFAVPLLMCGKWRTIATAVVTCLLASVPPAVLCGRSPITMILSIVEYSQGYYEHGCDQFVLQGMALVPTCMVNFLMPMLTARGVMALNALLGVIGCGVTTYWVVRRKRNWLFRLLPSVFFCGLWMVARPHDQVCRLFLYIGAVLVLLRCYEKLNKRCVEQSDV